MLKQKSNDCLTVDEEAMVLRYYELQLKDFCEKFEPPMTKMAIVNKKTKINSIHLFDFSNRLFVCNILKDFI